MPRLIIFFSFKDSFKDNFKIETTFKGLSNITSYIKTFFLAGTKVEAGVGARVGIKAGIGVFKIKAFSSYTRLNKDSI
jgi:hypothetical protein